MYTCDEASGWTRYFVLTLFDYVIDEASHEGGAYKDSSPQTTSSPIKGSKDLLIVNSHVITYLCNISRCRTAPYLKYQVENHGSQCKCFGSP